MTTTFYRRPLPAPLLALDSPEGRTLLAESLASGHLESYFPLAEQFQTQAEPSFCGLTFFARPDVSAEPTGAPPTRPLARPRPGPFGPFSLNPAGTRPMTYLRYLPYVAALPLLVSCRGAAPPRAVRPPANQKAAPAEPEAEAPDVDELSADDEQSPDERAAARRPKAAPAASAPPKR